MKIEDLVILGLGPGEQILGELMNKEAPHNLTERCIVYNPKRYLRVQQMTPDGLSIQFLIGDLDMMSSGIMSVKASWGYFVKDMDVRGQTELLRLYTDFLARKVLNRAKEVGLHLPKGLVK